MFAAAIETFTLNDLLTPGLLSDPYPVLRQLRRESPVHEDPSGRGWILSRFEECAAVLADSRFSAQWIVTQEEQIRGVHPVMAGLRRQMLFQDPPNHTRLRSLFSKAFTPVRMEMLRPQIHQVASRLMDEAEQSGGCIDFMEDIAVSLPISVIADMLGIPREDHRQILEWSLAFGMLISGAVLTPAMMYQAQQAIFAITRYLVRLIALKRSNPGNDMISDLLALQQGGDRLDSEDLIQNLILLIAAGHGTTTHLLGNSLLALLRHPEQYRLLGSDPSIHAAAATELLRYDGPVFTTTRMATENVAIGGRLIRSGDKVTLMLNSCNHDESRYTNPEHLDLRRSGPRSLAFGHGIHTCIGSALGRMEVQIVLGEFARRFPATWLEDNDPPHICTIMFRGLRSLPVTLS